MRCYINLLVLATFLILTTTLSATEWRWQEDPTFYNPNVDPELIDLVDHPYITCMADLSGDGIPEYILTHGGYQERRLALAEQTGQFPDITWRLNEDFFGDIEFVFSIAGIVSADLNYDGSNEIILVPGYGGPERYAVLENDGGFDDPDWHRADDLFPDVEYRALYCIPNFCDYDGDDLLDLVFDVGDRLVRYEINENGDWDEAGVYELRDFEYSITSYMADLDGDGDYDILGTYDMPCEWTAAAYTLNLGTPDEPEWSEQVLMTYYSFLNPVPYDLNGDGFTDIVNGWSYRLHTGEEDAAEWDRAVSWALDNWWWSHSLIDDFNNDGLCELVKPFSYGSYSDPDFRMAQYRLTDAGWNDVLFFGDDYEDWWPWYTDLRQIASVDMLGDGSRCIATFFTDSEPPDNIKLYQDNDNGQGYDWREVDGFFASLNENYPNCRNLSFGDFDSDGDPDLVLLNETTEFFSYSIDNLEPTWELQPEWAEGLGDIDFKVVEFGDLDGDGDLDLLGVIEEGRNEFRALLYENIGNRQSPRWRQVEDAFAEVGLENEPYVHLVDINGDDKLDIVGLNSSFLNQTTLTVTDIPATPETFGFSAYPNPFNSQVQLIFNVGSLPGMNIAVYDHTGRIMVQSANNSAVSGTYSFNINAQGWPTGIYLVRIETGNAVYSKKLVLIR